MKKTNKANRSGGRMLNNPVAKFAHQFNKAQVYKDKSKYLRKIKHKNQEPFPILLLTVLEKVAGFSVLLATVE